MTREIRRFDADKRACIPRDKGRGVINLGAAATTKNRRRTIRGVVATTLELVSRDLLTGDSAVNVSKMYSAVSDGELLDLTILPIFQKLLTERHKSTARRGYRSNIASCPNISIKCDIVEYL